MIRTSTLPGSRSVAILDRLGGTSFEEHVLTIGSAGSRATTRFAASRVAMGCSAVTATTTCSHGMVRSTWWAAGRGETRWSPTGWIWSASTANASDEGNRQNPPMEQMLVPRLRGVFHQYAFVAAVVAGTLLVVLADGYLERFAVWVYAVALAAMFGASALYHRFPWRSPTARLRARRLDHAMIFVFIAGTYTAFALVAFDGTARIVGLATVWIGAAFGILLNLVWIDAPRWLTAVAYLGVGWVGLILIPQLFPALGLAAAVLVIVGGALYSVGALAYAATWPDPFPRTLGFHEIFHLLVVAAALTQFVALSLVVL